MQSFFSFFSCRMVMHPQAVLPGPIFLIIGAWVRGCLQTTLYGTIVYQTDNN